MLTCQRDPEIAVEREVEIEVRAEQDCPATISAAPVTDTHAGAAEAVVPVLADPAPRAAERALARFGLIGSAPPVFTACARAPLAGLLLAVPPLAGTGLLDTAHATYGELPNGFYSLDTMLCRACSGPCWGRLGRRARPGSTRSRWGGCGFGPGAGGRRSAGRSGCRRGGQGRRLDRRDGASSSRPVPSRPQCSTSSGQVRAYQGTRAIGKTHVPR